MDSLISRQAAIDALKEHRALFCDNTPDTFSKLSYAEKSRMDELDMAIATLINLPSAQPKQKKGKWRKVSADRYVSSAKYVFVCSECDENVIGDWNYCPNCGARMEEE